MRLSLPRWLILAGVLAGLFYWKQRQRRDQVLDEPMASKQTDVIDDALKTGIAEVGQGPAAHAGAGSGGGSDPRSPASDPSVDPFGLSEAPAELVDPEEA